MRLRTKMLLAYAPLWAAAGAVVVALAARSVHRVLLDELAQRAIGRGTALVREAAGPIRARREAPLLARLLSFKEEARASYAVALDASGYVVAHTDVVDRGRTLDDDATREALARPEPGYRVVDAGGRAALDVALPVWEQGDDFLLSAAGGRRRVGTIRVGLPLADAEETETRIVRRLAAVVLAAVIVGLALIVLLTHRLLRPVRPLTAAAAQIGHGRRGVTVPILSRDELGELAGAFNRMSADLAATTVSKGFLDDILNGMIDALIVLDREGRVRLANAAARRLLGRAEEDLLGVPEDRLFADGGGARLAAAADGNAEVELLAASGERIPVLLSSSRILDADGLDAGRVLVARDIRERKALEARMAQSEKLSAIGQLAAGVAHEINNPLGVILGFAQSVRRRLDSGDALELPLRSIEREAVRCKELVQSLLTFSRQDRRALAPLDLSEAAAGALALAEAQARVRGVELRRDLGEGPLPVRGNANQIQQIVINLCTNALDATSPGGSVTVSCRRRDAEGRAWARLEVRDTGSGIPPEIRKRIFDPFFTTKEPGKGTGLGLSLVYELVHRHRGRLDLTSEVGRGTSFYADFPMEAGETT